MAITVWNTGAVDTGSTSIDPPHPGRRAGHLAILWVVNKYPNNGPSTPADWTLLGQVSGGAGSSGIDTGNVYVTAYWRIVDLSSNTSETLNVSIPSANSSIACIQIFNPGDDADGRLNEWEDPVLVSGTDTTAGTSLSFTAGSDPGITAGDMLLTCLGFNTDAVTSISSVSVSIPGTSGGTTGLSRIGDTNTGQDCGMAVYNTTGFTGTSSGAPSFTGTANAGSPAGGALFVRLRATENTQRKIFFLESALASGSSHAQLADVAGSGNFGGWTVGTSSAGTYSPLTGSTKQPASSFTSTVEPDNGAPNTSECFRSTNALTMTFESGLWLFQGWIEPFSANGQDGRFGLRVFKGAAANGSDAVEMTTARAVTGQIINLVGATQISGRFSVTQNLALVVEYLFLKVAWEITGAANNAAADVNFRETTDCFLLTTPYTTGSPPPKPIQFTPPKAAIQRAAFR